MYSKLILLALVSVLGVGHEGEVRKWRSSDGEYSVSGTYTGLKVVITRTDGKVVVVPFDSLSKADQEFVRKQLKVTPTVNPKTKPPKPESDRVYLSKGGKEYHRAGCKDLAKVHFTLTLAQAKAFYPACTVCKPPK